MVQPATKTVATGKRTIAGLSNISSRSLEREFRAFQSYDQALIAETLAEVTKAMEKSGFALPAELIIFKSDHDSDTQHDRERRSFEEQCLVSLKKEAVQSYIKRAVLERLRKFEATAVFLSVFEEKRIKVRIVGKKKLRSD